MSRLIYSPDEFRRDEQRNLGRANGNVFQRLMGIEGHHDGQIMVRLKRKRFIVLDYGIEPTEDDIAFSETNPHIKIYEGAGRKRCSVMTCGKVGIPVCLYDSEPSETDSLYLRSGLCFACQRNLNEKRRTDRKKNPRDDETPTMPPSRSSFGSAPSLLYAIGPSQKKFKLNGNTIELNSDAVIVNGSVEGMRHWSEAYNFQDIGADLRFLARDAAADVETLLETVGIQPGSGSGLSTEAAANAMSAEAAAHVVADTLGNPVSSASINALYEQAFKSLNKSIFLLTQWKASWDVAMETTTDPTLAEAVASAAAVAAAADQGTSMVSLLLAAERKDFDESNLDVESYEV